MSVVDRYIDCGLLANGNVVIGGTAIRPDIVEIFDLTVNVPTHVSFDWPESAMTRPQFDLWCTVQEASGCRIDRTAIPNPPHPPSTPPS